MAGSLEKLNRAHDLLTDSYIRRLEEDLADNLPTDAATLSALGKFLKDNNVSADPADSDKIDKLREQMTQRSKENKAQQASNIVDLATRLKTGTE